RSQRRTAAIDPSTSSTSRRRTPCRHDMCWNALIGPALPRSHSLRLSIHSLIPSIRFTRGLGMARSGDLGGARAEIEAIKALRAALERSNQSYWADRSEEQILAISAWIAVKEGARDEAVKFMRAAADGEDGSVKHVAMENRLYPLRELYAELLLEMGQPAAALHEFETSLEQTP